MKPLYTENGMIDWARFSENPVAIHHLEQNMDKINWTRLSRNPAAIHLLVQNPDKISWKDLSTNPAAMKMLEQNPDKIDWACLCENPAAIHLILSLDYKKMKEENAPFAEELCAKVFEPARMIRLAKERPLWEYMEEY